MILKEELAEVIAEKRKKRMGRLIERVAVYVSVEEAIRMEDASLEAGMTLSSWARRVLLKEMG